MKGEIEVITIRNNGYTDCYTFLDNLLPHDLRFFILGSSGRQYISMNRKTQKHANYMGEIESGRYKEMERKIATYPKTMVVRCRYSSHVNTLSGNNR